MLEEISKAERLSGSRMLERLVMEKHRAVFGGDVADNPLFARDDTGQVRAGYEATAVALKAGQPVPANPHAADTLENHAWDYGSREAQEAAGVLVGE